MRLNKKGLVLVFNEVLHVVASLGFDFDFFLVCLRLLQEVLDGGNLVDGRLGGEPSELPTLEDGLR